jgi:hypothetical protein
LICPRLVSISLLDLGDRRRNGHAMANETPGRQTARIVKFTPRLREGMPLSEPAIVHQDETSEADDADEYRHRMKMNVAAAAFVTLLIVFGLWLAGQMAEFRAAQECLAMGARGACAAIPVPVPNR